eukprot:4508663-Pyramimonas_sp.AAC.1
MAVFSLLKGSLHSITALGIGSRWRSLRRRWRNSGANFSLLWFALCGVVLPSLCITIFLLQRPKSA